MRTARWLSCHTIWPDTDRSPSNLSPEWGMIRRRVAWWLRCFRSVFDFGVVKILRFGAGRSRCLHVTCQLIYVVTSASLRDLSRWMDIITWIVYKYYQIPTRFVPLIAVLVKSGFDSMMMLRCRVPRLVENFLAYPLFIPLRHREFWSIGSCREIHNVASSDQLAASLTRCQPPTCACAAQPSFFLVNSVGSYHRLVFHQISAIFTGPAEG